MSKNKRNGGQQAPAQQHAEGQHGRKTMEFLRKQHAEQSGSSAADTGPRHERAGRQSRDDRKGS